MKNAAAGLVRKKLGPDYDVGTHFTPRYNPWDQRLCLVPDADLFRAIRRGKASVVTDHIETLHRDRHQAEVRQGAGGRHRRDRDRAQLELLGGVKLAVDGKPVDLSETLSYKGMMYSDVPNLASVFGYTNASWTLKADLTCEYVCRLLNHMDRNGWRQCTPRNGDPTLRRSPGSTSPRATSSARWRSSPSRARSGLEAVPELRARPVEPAIRPVARRRDGVSR